MDLDALSNFQLYYKISNDNGRSWSEARRFTTFNDPEIQTQAHPNNFDNQRPHITRHGNNLFLVWERGYSNQLPQIYTATIDQNGNRVGTVDRVNSAEAFCQYPIGFLHNNIPSVVWFDNRGGNNQIILAQRGDFDWQNFPLSSVITEASFGRPAVCRDGVYLFWQTTAGGTGFGMNGKE
jgi:hypothetical protein